MCSPAKSGQQRDLPDHVVTMDKVTNLSIASERQHLEPDLREQIISLRMMTLIRRPLSGFILSWVAKTLRSFPDSAAN